MIGLRIEGEDTELVVTPLSDGRFVVVVDRLTEIDEENEIVISKEQADRLAALLRREWEGKPLGEYVVIPITNE